MNPSTVLLLLGNAFMAAVTLAVLPGVIRGKYPGFRLSMRLLVPLSLISVVVTGVVVASMTQSFPAVVVPAPPGATSGCANLTNETNPVAPLGGTLRFDCASAGAAFSTSGGVSTPTFTLPTGYTRLGYVSHSATSCSGSPELISGNAVTIAAGGYDYCVDYNVVGAATLPSFTVTWSN